MILLKIAMKELLIVYKHLLKINEAQQNYEKMDYEARALAFNLLDNAEKALSESINIINGRKRKLIE